MNHLRKYYNDELGDDLNTYVRDGRVHIRSHHWSPGEVLEGMLEDGPEKDTFREWLQERDQRLLSLADEILAEFELADRFSILSEAYARGFVIPFIGAGLSMPSGYPGWTRFLQQLRKETTVSEAELDTLLTDGKYEEAAQVLSDDLGPAFNEAIENSFGCTRELDGAVQLMPYVFDGPIITTNFDDVSKRAYDQAQSAFEETISGSQSDEILRVLGAGRKVQVKLHGTSRTGSGRILTQSEYSHHYDDGESLEKVIHAVCNRTLLFLGCSLNIDRTLAVIRAYVRDQGHDNVTRHYAFLEDPGTDTLRVRRRDELAECNIFPIWYPQSDHDSSIEALLTKLQMASR